jgi:hypothetical protein
MENATARESPKPPRVVSPRMTDHGDDRVAIPSWSSHQWSRRHNAGHCRARGSTPEVKKQPNRRREKCLLTSPSMEGSSSRVLRLIVSTMSTTTPRPNDRIARFRRVSAEKPAEEPCGPRGAARARTTIPRRRQWCRPAWASLTRARLRLRRQVELPGTEIALEGIELMVGL